MRVKRIVVNGRSLVSPHAVDEECPCGDGAYPVQCGAGALARERPVMRPLIFAWPTLPNARQSRKAAKEYSPRRNWLRKNSKILAQPWKHGPSGPCKCPGIYRALAPEALIKRSNRVFPQPRKLSRGYPQEINLTRPRGATTRNPPLVILRGCDFLNRHPEEASPARSAGLRRRIHVFGLLIKSKAASPELVIFRNARDVASRPRSVIPTAAQQAKWRDLEFSQLHEPLTPISMTAKNDFPGKNSHPLSEASSVAPDRTRAIEGSLPRMKPSYRRRKFSIRFVSGHRFSDAARTANQSPLFRR
jgi:hypothetical protein